MRAAAMWSITGRSRNRKPIRCTPISPITAQSKSIVTPEVERESWLVLADSYYPGWKAFVRPQGTDEDQEKEVDIHLVNGNFRGVRLEPGAWIVRFRYSPATFQVGAFLSFLSGMLIIFMLMLWVWRRVYREESDGDHAKRIAKNSLAPIILNLFNRGIDFAFAFIMLRILGPANAGIYYYAIVIFGWFDILTNFGLNTLLMREVARDRERGAALPVQQHGAAAGAGGDRRAAADRISGDPAGGG